MDEVNADDLKELEARLYAEIHHEKASGATTTTTTAEPDEQRQAQTTSKVPVTRYWVKGSSNGTRKPPEKSKNLSISHISAANERITSDCAEVKESWQKIIPPVSRFTFQAPKPRKTHEVYNQVQHPLDADIRINPVATAKLNKRQRLNRQKRKLSIPPIPPNVLQDGPFAQKAQKLEKAIIIEAKRQKSKKALAKRKAAATETIAVQSSDESEGDDVILVPIPAPLTIDVDDSDDEKKEIFSKSEAEETEMLKIDENAVDAADVKMDCSSFIKPQPTCINSSGKRVENSSRCTSPCSVLSSDDFIGQKDRRRLLETSDHADDEDLLVLTTDVDKPLDKNILTKEVSDEKFDVEIHAEEESSNEVECLDFVEPTPTPTQKPASITKDNYRVEQPQFRALDVYESESDITDTVYSKGSTKPNIIRTIGSSSDEEEPAVSSQKSMINNKGESTNSETEDGNISGCATGVSFICRGPAVERSKMRARKSSLSAKSRRASTGRCASEEMCDSEFIATLNTLVQGGGSGNENSMDVGADDDVDSDLEDTPTAREIAENVLEQSRQKNATGAKRNEKETTENVASNSGLAESSTGDGRAALPDDALTELEKVFETIDQLEQPGSRIAFDDSVQVDSDTSDTNSGPEPEVQVVSVQMPAPYTRANVSKSKRETSGPVYNVIFSKGSRLRGGIGWNEEMRRFYNSSWNGENFNLKDVWQKLNPNKKLWKIYTKDRFPNERRFSNLKCNNCCEFGHIRAKCKRPKKASTCYMCGECGHYEPRCPNTICLRCGNKTHIFTKSCSACTFQNRLICPLCKVRGHTLNLCPDKWRRYHSTTDTNAYPNCQVEYKTKKYCCICGKRGHLSETCNSAVRFLEYPVIVSHVKSHQKSYNDLSIKTLQTGIGFNLLYKPNENYSFKLAEGTTDENYYGRFLKATGMGYMLKRKRRLSATVNPVTPAKQAKSVTQQYVRTKASVKSQNSLQEVPEQVQEITESGNLDTSDVEMQAEAVVSTDNDEVEFIADTVEDNDMPEMTSAEGAERQAIIEKEAMGGCAEIIDMVILNKDIDVGREQQALAVELQMNTAQGVVQPSSNESSNFKAPTKISPSRTSSEQQTINDTEPLPVDSDSNYSFSDHFELPQQTKTREMDPLPDYIPLDRNYDDGDDTDEIALQAGISRKFVTAETDEDESGTRSPLPDLPCEAKIYLTHFHSKYLLSPNGHAFLLEKSKACNIKARLDFTSVGHVLIIFGLPTNQDNFHKELLLKYRQLTDQMNCRHLESYQKVPKRADVLIRFLRENLNQLFANLGNVNELLKRLKHLENQHSKTSWKLADKTRRSLNMILLGQAGLTDGDVHLDKLLLSLNTLINDYKPEDNASKDLRDEIDSHWKAIFTSYRHKNYAELVHNYNRLVSKNRIPKLNINPLLLGNKVLDVSFTSEQKERLQQQKLRPEETTPVAAKKHSGIVLNPLNPKNSKLLNKMHNNTIQQPNTALLSSSFRSASSPPPDPIMKIKSASHSSHKTHSLPMATKFNQQTTNSCTPNVKAKTRTAEESSKRPPFANAAEKSTVATKIKQITSNWQSACDNLLTEIEGPVGELKKGLVRVSKGPSMFWSRESIKYLDECIRWAASNTQLLEKLQRIQEKSRSGSLSYNDYRAVIKLHSAMLGK